MIPWEPLVEEPEPHFLINHTASGLSVYHLTVLKYFPGRLFFSRGPIEQAPRCLLSEGPYVQPDLQIKGLRYYSITQRWTDE